VRITDGDIKSRVGSFLHANARLLLSLYRFRITWRLNRRGVSKSRAILFQVYRVHHTGATGRLGCGRGRTHIATRKSFLLGWYGGLFGASWAAFDGLVTERTERIKCIVNRL